MDLSNPGNIIALLRKHRLHTKKQLGQNFLIDPGALASIIKAAKITSEDHVLEIGPGLGVLTQELCQAAKNVTSIELDQDLIPILQENLKSPKNLEIIHQDALSFTPPSTPYNVVANIPYNITSPLLNHFLQAENKPRSMTILMQKEVAEKICKLQPKMSVISLQVALFGQAKYMATVRSDSFFPAPKVDSAILHITTFSPDSPEYLSKQDALKILHTAKLAFKNGRKKLSNTLPELIEKLTELDLMDKRPQHLDKRDWWNITSA